MADLLSLVARLGIDTSEYEAGIKTSEGSMSKFGEFVKGGIKKVAIASAATLAAATTAVGALAKKSVEGYAEQEQLVGGVQKLYGNMGMSLKEYAKSIGVSTKEAKSQWKTLEKAQNEVLKNAQDAYKNAGMSASEYMEIATSFSASLINSLGGDTVKAAKQTDVAIQAISDNFNTFGGDIGMIQGAFQGFAKQNYTMLDNLKLGYGGTKKEMERLIEDAEAYAKANGKAADLSIDSFSDIVTAIDLIQQKQKIAGTTSREASGTIAGSFQALKSSWENLVTGFADPNADISKLVENVVTSAGTALANIGPAFTQALAGISTAISEVLPQAIEKIPELMADLGGPLIETGAALVSNIVTGISQNIPQIAENITSKGSKLINAGAALIQNISEGFVKGIPQLLSKALPMIENFTASIRANAGKLIEAGLTFITNLAQGLINSLPVLIAYVPQIVTNIAGIINDNAPKVLTAGVNIIKNLVVGIVKAIPVIAENMPKIIAAIWNVITAVNWISLGGSIVKGIRSGLKALGSVMKTAGKSAWNAFKNINWISLGKTVMTSLGNAIKGAGRLILTALKHAGTAALNAFKGIDWAGLGNNIISGIVRGIGGAASALFNKLRSLASSALSTAKKALGISSPSKLFRDEVGKQISAGWALGIDQSGIMVKRAMNRLNALATSNMPEYDLGIEDPNISNMASLNDDSYSTISMPFGTTGESKNVNVYNYITVDGAKDPEEYVEGLVREIRRQVRMA